MCNNSAYLVYVIALWLSASSIPCAQTLQPSDAKASASSAGTGMTSAMGQAALVDQARFNISQQGVLLALVCASCGVALAVALLLASQLWSCCRRARDTSPQWQGNQQQNQQRRDKSNGPLRFHSLESADAGSQGSLESGVGPRVHELRKYLALTPVEAAAATDATSIPVGAMASLSCAAAAADEDSACSVVKAAVAGVSSPRRMGMRRTSLPLLLPDAYGAGTEGSGGDGGGHPPFGPLSTLAPPEPRSGATLVVAVNSLRAAASAAASPPEPARAETLAAAPPGPGSPPSPRQPSQPLSLPLPPVVTRTATSLGRVPSQQHQQTVVKWAALRRLLEEERAAAAAAAAATRGAGGFWGPPKSLSTAGSPPSPAGALAVLPPPQPLPSASMSAWTAPAPAMGSDRLRGIELPDVDDCAGPGCGVGSCSDGRRRLPVEGLGAAATAVANGGGGSGGGGLLSRVFSRVSRPGVSPEPAVPPGSSCVGTLRVRHTVSGELKAAAAAAAGDSWPQSATASAASAGSAARRCRRPCRSGEQHSRPVETVIAFNVDASGSCSGAGAADGSCKDVLYGQGHASSGDDDDDGVLNEQWRVNHGLLNRRAGLPFPGVSPAIPAWGNASTLVLERSFQRRLDHHCSVVQDASGREVLVFEGRRPPRRDRFSDLGDLRQGSAGVAFFGGIGGGGGRGAAASGGGGSGAPADGGGDGISTGGGASFQSALLPRASLRKRTTIAGFLLAFGGGLGGGSRGEIVPHSQPLSLSPRSGCAAAGTAQPPWLPVRSAAASGTPSPLPSPRQPLLSLNGLGTVGGGGAVAASRSRSVLLPIPPTAASEAQLVEATRGSHVHAALGFADGDEDVVLEEAPRSYSNLLAASFTTRGGNASGIAGSVDGGAATRGRNVGRGLSVKNLGAAATAAAAVGIAASPAAAAAPSSSGVAVIGRSIGRRTSEIITIDLDELHCEADSYSSGGSGIAASGRECGPPVVLPYAPYFSQGSGEEQYGIVRGGVSGSGSGLAAKGSVGSSGGAVASYLSGLLLSPPPPCSGFRARVTTSGTHVSSSRSPLSRCALKDGDGDDDGGAGVSMLAVNVGSTARPPTVVAAAAALGSSGVAAAAPRRQVPRGVSQSRLAAGSIAPAPFPSRATPAAAAAAAATPRAKFLHSATCASSRDDYYQPTAIKIVPVGVADGTIVKAAAVSNSSSSAAHRTASVASSRDSGGGVSASPMERSEASPARPRSAGGDGGAGGTGDRTRHARGISNGAAGGDGGVAASGISRDPASRTRPMTASARAVLQMWQRAAAAAGLCDGDGDTAPTAADAISAASVVITHAAGGAATSGAAAEDGPTPPRPMSRWALRKAAAIAAADSRALVEGQVFLSSLSAITTTPPAAANNRSARGAVAQERYATASAATATTAASLPASEVSAAPAVGSVTPEQRQLRQLQEELRRLRSSRGRGTAEGWLASGPAGRWPGTFGGAGGFLQEAAASLPWGDGSAAAVAFAAAAGDDGGCEADGCKGELWARVWRRTMTRVLEEAGLGSTRPA